MAKRSNTFHNLSAIREADLWPPGPTILCENINGLLSMSYENYQELGLAERLDLLWQTDCERYHGLGISLG